MNSNGIGAGVMYLALSSAVKVIYEWNWNESNLSQLILLFRVSWEFVWLPSLTFKGFQQMPVLFLPIFISCSL